MREKLEALGAVVAPLQADAFGEFLAKEVRTWAGVIKQAGIRAD